MKSRESVGAVLGLLVAGLVCGADPVQPFPDAVGEAGGICKALQGRRYRLRTLANE